MIEKSDKRFLAAMTACGIIAGIAVAGILMAIAVPAMSPYLLTLAEKADAARMSRYAELFSGTGMTVLTVIVGVAGIFANLLMLGVINPYWKTRVRNWRSKEGLKQVLAGLTMICWFIAVVNAASGTFSMGPVARLIVITGATALLWTISGARGWAGSIIETADDAPLPKYDRARTALLGAAAGLIASVLIGMLEWTQGRYFILVSEVLDRSGETSFLGYQLLAAGFIIMLGTSFLLFGWFVVALAPVGRDGAEMKQMLKGPSLLFAGLAIMIFLGYGYAGMRYDLDKKDLAAVLNLPATASESGTIVVLQEDKGKTFTVQEGPRAVSGSGFSVQSTVALSGENLKKVEAYLGAHPDGSVFTYTAREILYKGYHALWDAKNGLAWQVKAAASQLVPRMLLLARFRALPVTDENVRLLEAFSDEAVWSAGGRSALSIAKGYQHFGRTVDARRWLDKARSAGAEGATDDILKGPVVTDGTVRGRLLVNGVPPKDARVALLSTSAQRDPKEAIKVSDLTLGKLLVDAKPLLPDGRFSFDRLGSGTYIVAFKVAPGESPSASRSDALIVRPAAGPIRIGPERMKDLGTIEIVFKP